MPVSKPKQRARSSKSPLVISTQKVRAIWLQAQRLTEVEPFGAGPDAVRLAIEHLGYVQIDTISVIERCHHHILFNRIPEYCRADLEQAQSVDKSVFEYWTHALSFVPVCDLQFYVSLMKRNRKDPSGWSASTSPRELRKVLRRVAEDGALAISDIKDDKLVDKGHLWGSRKPSKRALQAGFYNGQLAIARRDGMLKTYELMERHFGWEKLPKAASETQTNQFLLDSALRTQGLVGLDSVCYQRKGIKPAIAKLLDSRVRAKKLVSVVIEGAGDDPYWVTPEVLDAVQPTPTLTHILSPFDPLIIQRKRTSAIFGYDHLFEAYVPKAKRKMGYFTLPVLVGDEIVAAIDLKTDRQAGRVLTQAWHWVGGGNAPDHKARIEKELERFSAFQLSQKAG